MELTIQVNPVERTVRLREVRALAAGDSCSVVLEGVRGADVFALRLALYRDAASDSPVASCPSFAPVRGHPNLATGDLRLDTTEMAAWFEAVRPEPAQDGTPKGRPEDAAERAVRTDGWLVVSEPTRTWAACRVPVILRPGAGASGVVDPTSIQSLVEGLVSASMSEALETKADLVDGKVPIEQLPSFWGSVLEYDAVSAFPTVGESGKIYVAKDTNKTYRWDVTQYVEISKSLALGETAETAYPGDKGKAAAETAANALGTADSAYTVAGQAMHDTAVHSENKENPHAVTAAQVGAVQLVDDSNGKKTAVTIGTRLGTVGPYSLANGNNVTASGQGTHAEGLETVASGVYSRADGMFTEALGPGSYTLGYMTKTLPSHRHAFVWNGHGGDTVKYPSKGEGTFNINPVGGSDGFYIGEKKLSEVISDGVANKADKATTLAGYGIADAATKTELDAVDQRAANGILGVQSELSKKADLVDGKVPANQLPAYVDDVLEYDAVSTFPSTGEAGKIYVAKDTNKTYRWGGTQYVEISQSLALGETAETAYPGDKGAAAADLAALTSRRLDGYQAQYDSHLQNKSNPHGVTAAQVNAYTKTDVDNKLANKADKTALDAHVDDTNNPHGVTAAQAGAIALNAQSTVGASFSVQYPDTTGSGDVLSFGVGAGPGGNAFVVNKLYCSGEMKFFANGVAIVNEESVAGASVLGRIKEYGGDFKTARAEVDNLIAASAATKADKSTTLAGYGITDAATKTELNAKADKSALAAKADKATTLAGYGITDAVTKTELNALAAKVDAANAALEEVA